MSAPDICVRTTMTYHSRALVRVMPRRRKCSNTAATDATQCSMIRIVVDRDFKLRLNKRQ